jgi:hypothetical protein
MSEVKFTPGPWEYNDPGKFQQPLGKFSDVAVYAAGNAFPWRMAEIQGPNEATEIATARLIAAAPDLYEALESLIYDARLQMANPSHHMPLSLVKAEAAIARARGDQS